VSYQEQVHEERSTIGAELENLKSKLKSTEKANLDLISELERERLLQKNKTAFLEQQREAAR
jgi:hypothetical protein